MNTNGNAMKACAGSALRELRQKRGMSQQKLASRGDLSLSIVRWAEKGLASDRTLARVARVLGCSVEELQSAVP